VAVLRMLGVLAAIAVIASELPWMAAVALASVALVYGEWLARRESRRAVSEIVIPPNEAAATINGSPMQDLHVQWRGPLAFLHWRDEEGRRRYLQGWPDNLPEAARRELRLATGARAPAHSPRSVAP
jgi:toxin CptA